MKVNMDGIRHNITKEANKLGESIKSFNPKTDSNFEIVKAFNNLVPTINALNYISDDKDESFNEIIETVMVYTLPDEGENL